MSTEEDKRPGPSIPLRLPPSYQHQQSTTPEKALEEPLLEIALLHTVALRAGASSHKPTAAIAVGVSFRNAQKGKVVSETQRGFANPQGR